MSNFAAERVRDLRRLEELVRVLAKYGLADWLKESAPGYLRGWLVSEEGDSLVQATPEQRVRLALSDLGPTFIKIGQLLSTRVDLVTPALAEELSKLQASAPADTVEEVRETILEELGASPEELFDTFDEEPVASASIGQVHFATIDGEAIVVKVQHRGIEDKIFSDLAILARLAALAETYSAWLRPYRPRALAEAMKKQLKRELDFEQEAQNLDRFADNFEGEGDVIIPRPYHDLTTKRVLTMQRVSGTPVRESQKIKDQGIDLSPVADHGADVFVRMMFEHGFYHADPHPGNILIDDQQRLVLLDCGMAGRLAPNRREQIEDLLRAAVERDSRMMSHAILRIGETPASLDREQMENELGEFVADYGDAELNKVDMGAMFNDFTAIIRRHHVLLPADVSMLLRMLVLLEGTAQRLDPQFSLAEVLKPYLRRSLRRRYHPRRVWRRMMRLQGEWQRLAEVAPVEIMEMMQRIRKGQFDIHLQHRRLDVSANRLIYGILTAACLLSGAYLLGTKMVPRLGGISVLGMLLIAAAGILGVRLLWAVEHSGGLRRERDDE